MATTIPKRGKAMTMTIDTDAETALRLMAPGPKVIGRFVSGLIMQEVERRMLRAQHPDYYARVLREPSEVGDGAPVATL